MRLQPHCFSRARHIAHRCESERWPSPASQTQAPWAHWELSGQVAPQAPQLHTLASLTHTPSHSRGLDAGHWHWPPTQAAPGGHSAPQEPQWRTELVKSTQARSGAAPHWV